jgi:transcriptional regulator with XRE-family HTH domain
MEDALIQRIREVRLANNLNMTQFAIRINSEQKTVNNYLNGKRKLSLEFVESIIRTFGLDANWLLFGTENPKQNNPLENSPPDNDMIDYKVKWIELLEENIELLRKITKFQEVEKSLENTKGGAVAIARAAKVG